MSKKILLASVAGGIVLFIWGAVVHMALGIGESSMKTMQMGSPAVLLSENLSSKWWALALPA